MTLVFHPHFLDILIKRFTFCYNSLCNRFISMIEYF